MPPTDPFVNEAVRAFLATGRTPPRGLPGSFEQRVHNRVVYLRRRSAHPGLTARQALGHQAPGDVLPVVSFFGILHGEAALIERVTVSRRDASRVGRYLSLVAGLLDGRVSPAAFRARVRTWRPVNVIDPAWGKVHFVSDPAIVLALATAAQAQGVESWVDSGRRRSPRRGRK